MYSGRLQDGNSIALTQTRKKNTELFLLGNIAVSKLNAIAFPPSAAHSFKSYFFSRSLILSLLHCSLSSLVVLLRLITVVSDINSLGSDVDDFGRGILPPRLAAVVGAVEADRGRRCKGLTIRFLIIFSLYDIVHWPRLDWR